MIDGPTTILLGIIIVCAAMLGAITGVSYAKRWWAKRAKKSVAKDDYGWHPDMHDSERKDEVKEAESTPLKARKGPLEARTPQDGTIPHPLSVIAPEDVNDDSKLGVGQPGITWKKLEHKHMWRIQKTWKLHGDLFYKFKCGVCDAIYHKTKDEFWNGRMPLPNVWTHDPDQYTTHHEYDVTADSGHRDSPVLVEALEAIRFTQEYAQLPCVDGWSWWDFYKKYRPDDAKRLKNEWEAFKAVDVDRLMEKNDAGYYKHPVPKVFDNVSLIDEPHGRLL